MQNYSAKGGPFFEINNGVPKDPTNAGPGGEKFYQGRVQGLGIPSESVNLQPNGAYVHDNGVTQGQAGPKAKSGGLSADGDMANWKPTDPFTSYNSAKKTN